MITNPILHALIVVGLAIVLATLSVAMLYQIVTGGQRDPNLGMTILAVLALLQGYIRANEAVFIAKNGNGN